MKALLRASTALAAIGLLAATLGGCRSRDTDRDRDGKPSTPRDERRARPARPFPGDDAMRDGDRRDESWRAVDGCHCMDAYECACSGHDHIDHHEPLK